MRNCSVVLLTTVLVTCSFAQLKQPVRTESGLLSGVPGRDVAITVFKGIPYAAPPVGKLRWTAPRPPQRWEGVRKADRFTDGCPQDFPKLGTPMNEDCLYLNVWTPAKSSRAALPIIVWIHGGGLIVGAAREPLFDGEEIAKKGIVVVTLDYRLGVLGFFAHPDLAKESPHHASGDYGFLDELAALQWIHHNIAAFGGDPNKVTIFGQSAGALSVNALVASPLAKGLFRAGISESGGVGAGLGRTKMPSLEESEKAGVEFAKSMGAGSLEALRAMPAKKLLQDSRFPEPNVDGWFFPESIEAIYRSGKQNKVPLLLGSNSDEGQHFIRSVLSASDFAERARKDYGADANKFLELYPSESDQSAKVSQQHEFADKAAVAERNLAGYVARGGAKAYLYYFAYLDTGGYNSEPPGLGLTLGADHGAELPYVFGLLSHWKTTVPENDLKVQKNVMSYWTNFVKTLNPNGPGLPDWKSYTENDDAVMILNQKVGMQAHPRSAQLDFLNTHGAQ